MSPYANPNLLLLRQDAADRWLTTHPSRRPAPARDARHLRTVAQAARQLAPSSDSQAGAAAEIDAFLDVIARRVLDRPAPDQPRLGP